jgi:hypothetical protein
MTHIFGHIECGGGGAVLGEKEIKIWDHEFLNVANHLKHDELVARLVHDGKSQQRAEHIVHKLGERIHRDIEAWYERLEDLGIDYHYHQPHAENLP